MDLKKNCDKIQLQNQVQLKKFLPHIKRLLSAYIKPKFAFPRSLMAKPMRILDVGIANDSYLECKAIFPDAEYHGLDFFDHKVNMSPLDCFFLRDLNDPLSLINLPGNYDLIITNHVLEHIERGYEVFEELCNLLTPGGILYVELPSIRTAFNVKKAGRYHFHDDPTHCRFYNLELLANIAIGRNCKVLSCGPVSTFLKDFFSIPRAFLSILSGGGYGVYLLHFQRKIDHVMIKRHAN
jgi:hypothetical protein